MRRLCRVPRAPRRQLLSDSADAFCARRSNPLAVKSATAAALNLLGDVIGQARARRAARRTQGKRPLLPGPSQCACCATLTFALRRQVFFEEGSFDVRRAATFTALGGLLIGPALHFWCANAAPPPSVAAATRRYVRLLHVSRTVLT